MEENQGNVPAGYNDAELLRIVKQGLLPKYDLEFRCQGYRPWEFQNLETLANWSDSLHRADQQAEHLKNFSLNGKSGSQGNKKRNANSGKVKAHKKSRYGKDTKQAAVYLPCGNCGRTNHPTDKCRAPGGAMHDAKKWRSGKGKPHIKNMQQWYESKTEAKFNFSHNVNMPTTNNVANNATVLPTPQEKVNLQQRRLRKRKAEEAYHGGVEDQEAELAGDPSHRSACPELCGCGHCVSFVPDETNVCDNNSRKPTMEELRIRKQSLQETLVIAWLAQSFVAAAIV